MAFSRYNTPIYGPSMPIMFDVENEKPPVTVDGKSKMKPVESYEVKILIGFYSTKSL
jgi:ATP-binding protein involved in chromosome partitioning